MKRLTKKQSLIASVSLMVLVIGVVASITVGGLVLLVSTQFTSGQRSLTSDQAFAVAEAGINYYKWVLAHDPADFTDGTGQPGPYIHDYTDPGGQLAGQYSLVVDPPAPGSTIITVTSTGWLTKDPTNKRTLQAQFGIPALTQYAFLHNSNVWFGNGMTVDGPIMSNGGIRQDGVNTSTLKSLKETYTCGNESGCDPPETKPGIWGTGGPQELWEFPATTVDFNAIIVDFAAMKAQAQATGLYLPHSGAQGYHLTFLADGTFRVHTVTSTDYYKGWSPDYLCQNLYQIIEGENLVGSYPLSGKNVIFVEDTLWVEGTVNGKVTVVAAQFPIDANQRDIWIPDNLVYLDKSGDHALGLIAQHDILFAKDVPNTFEVNGALLSQSSRVMRHHYNYQGCRQGNPGMKNELIIYGSVISNLIAYWNFGGGGGGNPTSGFVKRTITHDPHLVFNPPPSFPTSGEIQLLDWKEIDNP